MTSIFQKIEVIECQGDRLHNENLNILFGGVDKRSKNYKVVNAMLQDVHKDSKQRWIINIIHKNDCKRINAIMKSKTDTTFKKRIDSYVKWLGTSSHYGALFNKDLINGFKNLN